MIAAPGAKLEAWRPQGRPGKDKFVKGCSMFDLRGFAFFAMIGILAIIAVSLWVAYILAGWIGVILAAIAIIALFGGDLIIEVIVERGK